MLVDGCRFYCFKFFICSCNRYSVKRLGVTLVYLLRKIWPITLGDHPRDQIKYDEQDHMTVAMSVGSRISTV